MIGVEDRFWAHCADPDSVGEKPPVALARRGLFVSLWGEPEQFLRIYGFHPLISWFMNWVSKRSNWYTKPFLRMMNPCFSKPRYQLKTSFGDGLSVACGSLASKTGASLRWMHRGLLALMSVWVAWLAPQAWAVRPFVTDDARIIEYGQFETETWFEYAQAPGERLYAQNIMAGVTLTDWLELIAGTGIGWDQEGHFAVANPVIQPKYLLWNARENGFPGLALATGLSLPTGRGAMFEDATSGYALALTTVRLYDDWLQIHGNVGATFAKEGGVSMDIRPYWGIGLDVGVAHPDWRWIVEAYSGDPLHAIKPAWAAQTGVRWLKSDHLNFDITLGMQPHLDANRMHTSRQEWWIQFGVRILIDGFTRDGKAGDPMGAPGMFFRGRR